MPSAAPTLLTVDTLVRFSRYKGPQYASNTHLRLSPNTRLAVNQCGCCTGMDGRHQARHHL